MPISKALARVQADGKRLTDPNLIVIGWMLELPEAERIGRSLCVRARSVSLYEIRGIATKAHLSCPHSRLR